MCPPLFGSWPCCLPPNTVPIGKSDWPLESFTTGGLSAPATLPIACSPTRSPMPCSPICGPVVCLRTRSLLGSRTGRWNRLQLVDCPHPQPCRLHARPRGHQCRALRLRGGYRTVAILAITGFIPRASHIVTGTQKPPFSLSSAPDAECRVRDPEPRPLQ